MAVVNAFDSECKRRPAWSGTHNWELSEVRLFRNPDFSLETFSSVKDLTALRGHLR